MTEVVDGICTNSKARFTGSRLTRPDIGLRANCPLVWSGAVWGGFGKILKFKEQALALKIQTG